MNKSVSVSAQKGFTLVELVMVIVLIGILSYGASSLFFSRGKYASFVAKDQLISSALLAQQMALGMSAASAPVSLNVGVNVSGEWEFTLIKAGFDLDSSGSDDVVTRVTQEPSGGSLIIDGTTLNAGDSQTFTWNGRADLTSGANHQISFLGELTHIVCLSSSGFAYEASSCP